MSSLSSDITYTVGELTDAINLRLRDGFGDGVWVVGEISGVRVVNGHTYFSLVEDEQGAKATMSAALFANAQRSLRPVLQAHRLDIADGTKVRVFGQLDVYAPTGRLSLKISDIDPKFTLGDISASRERVLAMLAEQGLLRKNGQCVLPVVPLRIAVVTSIGSAAWHDFTDELTESGFAFDVIGIDARVQGEQAESMVAHGVRTAAEYGVDIIAVIRGGGARNELAAFDTEGIARAIAGSPVPVITGLGHEIDTTVADEVAHTALKTPTACAGWLVEQVARFVTSVESRWREISTVGVQQADNAHYQLESRATRIAGRTHAAVARSEERLLSREHSLRRAAVLVDRATHLLDERQHRLTLLDPQRLLDRGWSITVDERGRAVTSVNDLTTGDLLTTRVADGVVKSTVTSSQQDEE